MFNSEGIYYGVCLMMVMVKLVNYLEEMLLEVGKEIIFVIVLGKVKFE